MSRPRSIVRRLTLVALVALGLGVVGPARARAGTGDPAATDRAVRELKAAVADRATRLADKQRLGHDYDAELADLDRLKRGKPSWRRDRQIADKKSDAQSTATALATADRELADLEGKLGASRRGLVAAIDAELAAGTTAKRRAYLGGLRADAVAALAPRVKKILLPDDSLDELADPDELADQVALIAQAEQALKGQEHQLGQREEHYQKMAKLAEQHERASELGSRDDDAVRHGAGQSTGRNAGSPSSLSDQDGGGAAVPGGGGASGGGASGLDAGFEASSVALADVVDSATVDALRKAGRSSDPATRAAAAGQARKQVAARLERLARSRKLIESHLRQLQAE